MEDQSTQIATSSRLEELMILHEPVNLTGVITLSTQQPVDIGGFAKVYRGSWADKPVGIFDYQIQQMTLIANSGRG
jgi:hypothetical protein